MKSVDVAIIGAGRAGRLAAERLANRRKTVAQFALPDDPEDALANMLLTLAGQPPLPGSSISPTPVRLVDETTVHASGERVRAKNIVIAAGCVPQSDANETFLADEEPEIAERMAPALRARTVRLRPATQGLGLDDAGVLCDPSGAIVVNEEMRTSNPRIFAIGSVTGPRWNLEYEGVQAEIAAVNIDTPFFLRRRLEPEAIPETLPLDPPFARVGLTEAQARARFGRVVAVAIDHDHTRIKLVGKKRTGELLGAHLYGPSADTLVLFFDVLIRAGISLREVADGAHYPGPGGSAAGFAAVTAWLAAAEK